MRANKFLDKIKYGQFLLEDRKILQEIADQALIERREVVLEIGAGDGRLTKILAKDAYRVIAVEIDPRFTPALKELPKNVQVIIGDALTFLSSRPLKKFSKIVANLPSALVEPLFQKLHRIDFGSGVFLVPEKFAYKLVNNLPFQLYFEVKLIQKVAKTVFFPVPRTNWEMISVKKIDNPLKSGNINLFLRQYLDQHPRAKLKNSLMEAVIKICKTQGKNLTKNQARKKIASFRFRKKILDSLPRDLPDGENLLGSLSKLLEK